MDNSSKNAAAIIDDLTTTDIGGRDTIYPISEIARERQGETPAMQAAKKVKDAVDTGGTVLVLTGFLIPPTMIQETDGPLGAVSIARAVDIGLDANAVIACEPEAVEICKSTATAGELNVLDRATSFDSKRTVAVEEFPSNRKEAEEYTDDILTELDPDAIVAVEKVAPNEAGVYHNMAGYDITEYTSKVDVLYENLDDDVLTISIGDAGNEVGMGLVKDLVRREIDYGRKCQCPCGEGIASDVETDILVPATVSNWGGHAIAACLSQLVDESLLHTPEVEKRMLVQASMAGSIDGIVGGTNAWCDGLPPQSHESMLQLIREVLSSSVHARGGGELGR